MVVFLAVGWPPKMCPAADGVLHFSLTDESTGDPAISRIELWRPDAQKRAARRRLAAGAGPPRLMPVRKSVPAGIGFVLNRQMKLELPGGTYQFRITRGPEYRIISGNFSLEKTSLDNHHVALPRMVDMYRHGWVSGDCLVAKSSHSLPLRMASEDLHVAAVSGYVPPRPIPGRSDDQPIIQPPRQIRTDVVVNSGLVLYPSGSSESQSTSAQPNSLPADSLPIEWLLTGSQESSYRRAIENPFAWPVPVWLATGKIDGVFLLGDWLRLDHDVTRVPVGRPVQSLIQGDQQAVGRWAETIYHQMLEAGLHLAPLAGSGDDSGQTPVGYNRVYAVPFPADASDVESTGVSFGRSEPSASDSRANWWRAAFAGRSCVTNGPCLRPKLAGQLPGHVFQASGGDVLALHPEVELSVRDPVDYLDVIHNGRVHYSAKLDEFARAGGRIPPLEITASGWVMIRVVTAYRGHLRAAISAPWYIVYDGKPRVTKQAIDFFAAWLVEYEQRLRQLPRDQLQRHVQHIQRARRFWEAKRAVAIAEDP